MNAIPFGAVARERMICNESKPDQHLDAVWIVLEAANDVGDDATVDACRRVIDANLNGTPASQPDLHVVLDYFR